MMGSAPHFRGWDTEQRAMVAGAEARLREYRRMLPGGDLATSLDGRFWDAVVVTAANEGQAGVYRAQLDQLHSRGQLPGERTRYLVVPDPPGPRVGSGGATLHVMLRLQADVGPCWRRSRILLLHAGGYSERSPAHGTLGKAFAQLPMDAANMGAPATMLEAQLVYLQELPASLPPGVFISAADVVLQMPALAPLDETTAERASHGILALGHASTVATGRSHGVFVCDRHELVELIRRSADDESRDKENAEPIDKNQTAARYAGVIECVRCLQKPSDAEMRAANAVLPTPAGMGLPGGGGGEWVLTDSAYHLGWRMCDALVKLAASHPEALGGVEICAYGDFMQPMGRDPDPSAAYMKRVDHVASVTSVTNVTASGSGSRSMDSSTHKGDRLRRARELVAACVAGKPLLIRPMLPSRFVHVGTMPELLEHTAVDSNVLAAYPAAHAGTHLGTWDSGMMDAAGFGASRKSIGADGVWGSGRSSGPGACMLASHVAMGARVGAGSLVAHCDVGALATVGSGCLLHDVDLPAGVVVPAGVFMHCVPLNEAAAAGAGVAVAAADASDGPNPGGARCWTCIVTDVKDEVKSATCSTLLGVPVAEAAARLGLDATPGGAVWAEGEAQTTTLARLFPVRATQRDAAIAALELLARVRGVPPGTPGRRVTSVTSVTASGFGPVVSKRSDKRSDKRSAARNDDDDGGLRVSVSEALRVLADHAAMMRRRGELRSKILGPIVRQMVRKEYPADTWLDRAPPLRSFVSGPNDSAATATARALELVSLAHSYDRARRASRVEREGGGRAGGGKREGGGDDDGGSPGPSRRELLAAGRVALALAPREGAPGSEAGSEAAEAAARRCLRAAVVSPFARAAPLFGRPAAEKAEKAAFFASVMSVLGDGDDDDPGEAPLPPAPAASAVSRLEKMAAVRAEYPARLNLAGGWTDTPPYSLERRGVVLHVPVLTSPYCGDDGSTDGSTDGGGALRRPISATASRLPGKPGLVRLVSEPGPGVPGRREELRSVGELLRCDDPSHPFALHRACVALTVAQRAAAANGIEAGGASDNACVGQGQQRKKDGPGSLEDLLTRFLGAPGMGLELRTRVDLPRGSGLGSSSVLALAAMHAMHELSTGCEWRPSLGDAAWAGASAVVVPPWSVVPAEPAAAPAAAPAAEEEAPAEEADGDVGGEVEEAAAAKKAEEERKEEEARAAAAAQKKQREDNAAAQTKSRPPIAWPTARDAFNAVLAVEQLMTTGGGWQDQAGGALVGMRLTSAASADLGEAHEARGMDSLPEYEVRVSRLPPPAAEYLSRHVVCVFTGAVRLAATVAKGVVDAWQRRAPGVEEALRACAAMGKDMIDAFDRLGSLPDSAFVGDGSPEARAELEAAGSILERHKVLQERLWPSINSPAVAALYAAVAPHATGSHICGAGNGGHVVVFLKPGVGLEALSLAVRGCAEAPDARVVRAAMMLDGGGGGDGGGSGTGGDVARGGGGDDGGADGGGKRRRVA